MARWIALLAAAFGVGSLLAAEPFGFGEWKARLTRSGAMTVEDALAQLPESFRSHFTYVFATHSLQQADPDHPRALVFSPNGKLVVAFNGDPKQAGFQRLETLEFRDDTRQFELREISFGADGKKTPRFSAANPRQCLRCHQAWPRPNWDPYANWPGVYGSDDDALWFQEARNFDHFNASRSSNPRYAWLAPLSGSKVSPYSEEPKKDFRFRPNFQLTLLFARLNAKRLADRIERAPAGRAYRYLLPLVWLRCHEPPAALVPSLERWLGDEVRVLTYDKSEYWGTFAALKRIVAIVGITAADWRIDFQPRGAQPDLAYRFFDGVYDVDALVVHELYRDAMAADPELAAAYRSDPYFRSYDHELGPQERVIESLGGALDDKMASAACPVLYDRLSAIVSTHQEP